MKNCSHKEWKKKWRLHANHAKRWLKRPEGTAKANKLAKLFDKEASKFFNLNYTGTPKLRAIWLS